MTHIMKKVSIGIMVIVFVATICLPLAMLPLKIYADSVPYAIGDVGPAGGIIFYVNGSSCLEAAPSDTSTGIAWITGGSTRTTLNGNTLTAIGTGQANTAAIIGQSGHTNSAAKICDDLILNGYSDWFLASKDELDQMWGNIANTSAKRTANGFAVDFYCSSSEYNATLVWTQVMDDTGGHGNGDKSFSNRVRAIRAFTGMKETGSAAATYVEPVWVRTQEMTCKHVWVNEDNKFQFSFIYPYRDNNWVKIYDMNGKEVYSIDMPYDNPNIIVNLPDGMYTVKTFNDQPKPIQTFVIGKP